MEKLMFAAMLAACASAEAFELSLISSGSPVQDGVQIAFPGINDCNTSKVRRGLLDFNKNGFLPVFPFVSIDMPLFK